MYYPLGILENVGKSFLTIRLADNTVVRRRSTSLRMLRPFKVPDLTADLTTTQTLDCPNTLICTNLFNCNIQVNVKGQLSLKLYKTILAPFIKLSCVHHRQTRG